MNLSMWMLLDELADFNPTGAIQDGTPTIEGFRMFSHEDTISSGYVFIGYADDFFGIEKNKVLLVHRCDMIFIGSGDIASVVNQVVCAFDKYRRWDEKLREARHELANPYQAILNVAHEMFECPMFFGNKNLHIYAITYQYPKEEVYEEWDDMKVLLTMPFHFLERWKTINLPSNFSDDIDPAIFPTWLGMKFEYQIRTNCYLNGKLWGHFYLYYKKKVVSPAILQLARYVGDLYNAMLQASQEKNTEKYSMYSWLVDILDGHNVPKGTIQSFCWMLKWAETDTLVLYKVSPSTTTYDQLLFFWLSDSIGELSGSAVVFPYKDSIIVIARDMNNQAKLMLDNIIRLISINDYRCGVSFTFKGLENIVSFYNQAGYALMYSPDLGGKVHSFKDCALEGLSFEMKAHLRWRDWVTPSLFKLIESDATQGTEYYITLYHLLVNKWHLGNTSRALFIHRNTLLYRLEKIGHLLEADIHDESTWAYLRFCYSMMMEDYPIKVIPPPTESAGND